MSKFVRLALYIYVAQLLVGCSQYRFGYGDLSERYTTISVPYVEGDKNGQLTAEVIKSIATNTSLRYTPEGGDLLLQVKVLETQDQNIGYRYDRKKNNSLKHAIIPTETRLKSIVEVVLIEKGSNQIIRGPTRIFASTDFDHDYYSTRNSVNIFSLGQLNDIEVAEEDAMYPLNRKLAKKIMDYVAQSW